MTGDGKSSRGTGRKSRSGKTCETSRITRPLTAAMGTKWNGNGDLESSLVVFEQNQRDEVRLTPQAGPVKAQPGMKNQTYLLISSAEDSPAKTLASLDEEQDSPESEAACSSSSPESPENSNRIGSSSRTSQGCLVPLKDWTSLSSSIRWTNSGTVWRGAFSIASSSESPSVAAECSLSDILVAHAHPKYSLSPKAAAGILRRAERRGRALPTHLEAALVALMNTPAQPTSPPPSKQATGITATQGQEATGQTTLSPNPCEQTAGAEVTATETRGMSSLLSPESVGMTEGATNGNPESGQTESLGLSRPSTAAMSVRRLTPTECERLQGFPDGWTHVHGVPMVGATPLWETLLRLWWPGGSGDES